MMNLFSSFDFKFWGLSALISYSLTCSIFYKIWVSAIMYKIIELSSNFLSSFFWSLSPAKMYKMTMSLAISMFIFIFIMNFSSVFSFVFPATSQVSVVLWVGLAWWGFLFSMFVSLNMKGLVYHLIPEGSPIKLVPLLFLAELISNLIRPITLTVRLVANILAGHLLMSLLSSLIFVAPILFPFLMMLSLVEFFVSVIQSYIFSTMIILYFSELN